MGLAGGEFKMHNQHALDNSESIALRTKYMYIGIFKITS